MSADPVRSLRWNHKEPHTPLCVGRPPGALGFLSVSGVLAGVGARADLLTDRSGPPYSGVEDRNQFPSGVCHSRMPIATPSMPDAGSR